MVSEVCGELIPAKSNRGGAPDSEAGLSWTTLLPRQLPVLFGMDQMQEAAMAVDLG